MPTELWLAAQREVDQPISLRPILSIPHNLSATTEDYAEMSERSPDDEKDGNAQIRGSIINLIDRLDDEFTTRKSLQNVDPLEMDHVERLSDEKALYQIICIGQRFYERTKYEDPLSPCRLEHINSKVRI